MKEVSIGIAGRKTAGNIGVYKILLKGEGGDYYGTGDELRYLQQLYLR